MSSRNVFIGILRVARGQKQGVLLFGATPEAVLASLLPLIALLLVAAAFSAISDQPLAALSLLLVVAISLLAPLVLSFEVARRWGRGAEWFRFATALCWCQWAAPVVSVVALNIMLAAGVPQNPAIGLVQLGLLAYGLWLPWFLGRHALGLSGWRAAGLVAIVTFTSFALISGPIFLENLVAG